jgi:hypothetical protein
MFDLEGRQSTLSIFKSSQTSRSTLFTQLIPLLRS